MKSRKSLLIILISIACSNLVAQDTTIIKIDKLLSQYNCFYRIHNSYIININQIKAYKKGDGGEVVLEDSERLPVSRNRKNGFLEWIYRVK